MKTKEKIQDSSCNDCKMPLFKAGALVAYALVSQQDFHSLSLSRWSLLVGKTTSYAYRQEHIKGTRSGNRCHYMHRVILGLPCGGGHAIEADHLNFNGLDNRRENLRVVTRSEQVSRRRPWSQNGSGSFGVYPPRGRSHLWTASIFRNGKYIHRSSHKTKELAITARSIALEQYESLKKGISA
jgi:hypothetical protein